MRLNGFTTRVEDEGETRKGKVMAEASMEEGDNRVICWVDRRIIASGDEPRELLRLRWSRGAFMARDGRPGRPGRR
jgi:hypothetical protein